MKAHKRQIHQIEEITVVSPPHQGEGRGGDGVKYVRVGPGPPVFEELCLIVEEAIELYRKDRKPLPPATPGRDIANRTQYDA